MSPNFTDELDTLYDILGVEDHASTDDIRCNTTKAWHTQLG